MMGFSDGSGISWTICKQSAPRSRQITTPTPHHSIFIDRMLFLTPNQQCQSIEGKQSTEGKTDMQTPRAMDTEMAKIIQRNCNTIHKTETNVYYDHLRPLKTRV